MSNRSHVELCPHLPLHAALTVSATPSAPTRVEVITPEESMGDVIGDINSRRGLISELAERGNMKVVRAKVPLANMFQYVSTLRSLSKGRASYVMDLDSYEIVPPNVEKELLSKYKGNTGDDEDED